MPRKGYRSVTVKEEYLVRIYSWGFNSIDEFLHFAINYFMKLGGIPAIRQGDIYDKMKRLPWLRLKLAPYTLRLVRRDGLRWEIIAKPKEKAVLYYCGYCGYRLYTWGLVHDGERWFFKWWTCPRCEIAIWTFELERKEAELMRHLMSVECYKRVELVVERMYKFQEVFTQAEIEDLKRCYFTWLSEASRKGIETKLPAVWLCEKCDTTHTSSKEKKEDVFRRNT